jgi:hypothetical protein
VGYREFSFLIRFAAPQDVGLMDQGFFKSTQDLVVLGNGNPKVGVLPGQGDTQGFTTPGFQRTLKTAAWAVQRRSYDIVSMEYILLYRC